MYILASHVRYCLSDGHLLLLDLRQGRYFGIPGSKASRLSEVIGGLPCHEAASATPELLGSAAATQSLDEILEEMLSAGMLRQGFADRSDVHHDSTVAPPAEPLIHGYEVVGAQITARHAVDFARACLTAKFLLRWRSLEALSRRLVRHRERVPLASAHSPRLRELVAVFVRMRPFLYTAYDACLFNSLALHEFLLHYGLRTQFIIGVTARPFKAHCWLQVGPTVVNDSPSDIWRFTPILAR
jgi:hypothetical protein